MDLEKKFFDQVCSLIETYTELAAQRRHSEEEITELGKLLAQVADAACRIAGVSVQCSGGACRVE